MQLKGSPDIAGSSADARLANLARRCARQWSNSPGESGRFPSEGPSFRSLNSASKREVFRVDALPDVLEQNDSQVEETGTYRGRRACDGFCSAISVHGVRLAILPLVDHQKNSDASPGIAGS
jgi:hypothetical protein